MDVCRTGARSRASRTVVVAALLALLAHVAADGRLGARTVGLAALIAAGLAVLAALRRPGLAASFAGLAGLQLAVHLTAATGSAPSAGDRLTFLCGVHGGSGGATTAHVVAMGSTHVAATLLGAWWLVRGDRLAGEAIGDLRRRLASLLAPPSVPVPARERAVVEAARRHCLERSGSVAGRSPPLGSWF